VQAHVCVFMCELSACMCCIRVYTCSLAKTKCCSFDPTSAPQPLHSHQAHAQSTNSPPLETKQNGHAPGRPVVGRRHRLRRTQQRPPLLTAAGCPWAATGQAAPASLQLPRRAGRRVWRRWRWRPPVQPAPRGAVRRRLRLLRACVRACMCVCMRVCVCVRERVRACASAGMGAGQHEHPRTPSAQISAARD